MKTEIKIQHVQLKDLTRLHDFVESACQRVGADENISYAVRLAVEEVCTNIIKHGYKGMSPGPIALTFRGDDKGITITIADRARPFSPDNAPVPNLSTDWNERQVGGLGWHLVKHMMDQVLYEPNSDGGNIVTLIKKF
jgi:serine/threonine-protein kinase RsbW